MALADFDMVLFGGSGDLAMRKLLPALYALDRIKGLPRAARIVCAARHDWSRGQFIETVTTDAKPHIPAETFDPVLWESFCARLEYVTVDAGNAASYQALVAAT